jgi:hypothetical protein
MPYQKGLLGFLIVASFLHSKSSFARAALAGPALTYGQNLGESDQLFLGGWGLFIGNQIRLGAAAYTHLSSYDPDGGSSDRFKMIYGGALVYFVPNRSYTTPVEFHLGGLIGGTLVAVRGNSWGRTWMIEPTAMMIFRLNEWFGVGLDARYRYVPAVSSGAYSFDELSGFSAGVSVVVGSSSDH